MSSGVFWEVIEGFGLVIAGLAGVRFDMEAVGFEALYASPLTLKCIAERSARFRFVQFRFGFRLRYFKQKQVECMVG